MTNAIPQHWVQKAVLFDEEERRGVYTACEGWHVGILVKLFQP